MMRLTSSIREVLETLSNNPGRFNTLTLSKKVNLCHTQAIKVVSKLNKNKFIEKEEIDKREKRLKITSKGEIVKKHLIELKLLGFEI